MLFVCLFVIVPLSNCLPQSVFYANGVISARNMDLELYVAIKAEVAPGPIPKHTLNEGAPIPRARLMTPILIPTV